MKRYPSNAWLLLSLLLVTVFVFPSAGAMAQETQPEGPVYVVQAGDSLWSIAQQFGLSLDELAQANNITNANQISEGAELVIPGLEGVQGVLVTEVVPFGESLRSLSRARGFPMEMLARLNHLTSPDELFAGASLVVTAADQGSSYPRRALLAAGQTPLELAILNSVTTWDLVLSNGLESPWQAMPGDILHLAGESQDGPGALPGAIQAVEISRLAVGKTGVIRVAAAEDLQLDGELMGRPLKFFPDGSGSYIALHGIHAMSAAGLFPMLLGGILPDGNAFEYSQPVYVAEVRYPFDRPLTVDPQTTDPAVTAPEDELWNSLTKEATPVRMWVGAFRLPSPLPQAYCLETGECWPSRFGNRRSYNGSPYSFFHTGLDIAGKIGTEIYAPAPGIVVFVSDDLVVRGKATVIDHGWGVYTAYMHQSEISVAEGDRVETGQVIGLVGNSGRVEGPHLHWEVWVGGVQVDPLDWLENSYP